LKIYQTFNQNPDIFVPQMFHEFNFPSSLTIDLLPILSNLSMFKSNGCWIEGSYEKFKLENGEEEVKDNDVIPNDQFLPHLTQLQVFGYFVDLRLMVLFLAIRCHFSIWWRSWKGAMCTLS